MTYFEKLVQDLGINKAFRKACRSCPKHRFPDMPTKDCTEDFDLSCAQCWTAEMPESKGVST